MGLFRDVGRRVERLKNEVTTAADETASYECADCGAAIHADRDTCPECGSERVREREVDSD